MAGELILIVEDNEKNRKLVRDVLQVKGYWTLETETAEYHVGVGDLVTQPDECSLARTAAQAHEENARAERQGE